MSQIIRIHQFGGAGVLQLEQYSLPQPAVGQIRIRHEAIGLNFIDVYHRTGLYPNILPFTPGSEAAGVVTAVGPGVTAFKPGDRVTYFGSIGSYCDERIMPAESVLPLPDDISTETAAAVTLKGMTACYLLTMTVKIKRGDVVLVHAAAGGVGLLLVQWAKYLGAEVIGTVGSWDKAEQVRDSGADEVINIREEPWVDRVRAATNGAGVDVVYDSIGKDTFEKSLACLRPRGLMVSFGNSSGPVAIPDLGVLASRGSLFVTRPTLAHYFADQAIRLQSAATLFELVRRKILKVNIGQRYGLADVAHAHGVLEGRRTIGSTILLPAE